ncbi:hypothetical protein [uncultured Thiohalocapsa sp.]|uniref:hypothetical protein n=1 Tax=uncultured Thiohalocapsa sp. TaxID=768990 RepID=UPI0025D1E2CB|nr:hypothetical protein [uncultured Thiohalocapsa sp.]
MKLCPKCAASPLPFVMIIVIAGVIGFITWLTLGLSEWDPWPRFGVAAVSTLAVAATLWHYVLTCMRRHCRHHDGIRRMTTSSHQISQTG